MSCFRKPLLGGAARASRGNDVGSPPWTETVDVSEPESGHLHAGERNGAVEVAVPGVEVDRADGHSETTAAEPFARPAARAARKANARARRRTFPSVLLVGRLESSASEEELNAVVVVSVGPKRASSEDVAVRFEVAARREGLIKALNAAPGDSEWPPLEGALAAKHACRLSRPLRIATPTELIGPYPGRAAIGARARRVVAAAAGVPSAPPALVCPDPNLQVGSETA
jgi:hypothetical protein